MKYLTKALFLAGAAGMLACAVMAQGRGESVRLVGNTRTKVFHLFRNKDWQCISSSTMFRGFPEAIFHKAGSPDDDQTLQANKRYFTSTDEAQSKDYTPCGRCYR